MKLTLTNSTLTVQVDPEDFNRVSAHRWALTIKRNKQYAMTRIKGRRIFLHRLIMGEPPGLLVDHEDGDGLNCQRHNLRTCTRSQNMANCKPHADRKGRYKGVYQVGKRFVAQICSKGLRSKIGTFDTARQAAESYDIAARVFFGEFAHVNFPSK
jgi:hypothetical protein